MKTVDFENAIENLNSSIELDEVKLKNGNVTRFFGHIGRTLIMWDDFGRSYTFHFNINNDVITHDTHDCVNECCYQRCDIYDLKF